MPIFINRTKINNVTNQTAGATNIDSVTGKLMTLSDISKHIYDDDEIKEWRMDEAIQNNPLSKKPINMRSKVAYRTIMQSIKPTKKYLLPGEICVFNYSSPKYQAELEYYDATPFVLFFGITRTKDGVIREVGFNLHYYPPFARMKILNTIYEVFKSYYVKYFNNQPNKPNNYINYRLLKTMLRSQKIKFGLKMYIPVLRGNTYVLPTKLIPIAAQTEGHFSGVTLAQIKSFWRKSSRS